MHELYIRHIAAFVPRLLSIDRRKSQAVMNLGFTDKAL
jgi:hypothetical protein